MLHDYFAAFTVKETEERAKDEAAKKEKENIDELVRGEGKYAEVSDRYARSVLLLTAHGIENKLPDSKGRPEKINPEAYARVGVDNRDGGGGLKAIVHRQNDHNNFLADRVSELKQLEVDHHFELSDLDGLPMGSWYLEMPVFLKTPFYFRDDIPFYIIDNPLRKEKVFGVPFTAATTWKGRLRWSMMKVHLEPAKDNPELFAKLRYQHFLLFGSEKGEEYGDHGWAAYLDRLGGEEAKALFRDFCRKHFQAQFGNNGEVGHSSGMLHFFPTFWTEMEMAVINPHDRQTKAGQNPIYYEVIPPGAKGGLRLLFVPLHWLGKDVQNRVQLVLDDLIAVVAGLEAMLFKYGFSAKKSLGWGVVKDTWPQEHGVLHIKGIERTITFSSLKQLQEEIERLKGGGPGGEPAETVGR